jgi:hypothetical protein
MQPCVVHERLHMQNIIMPSLVVIALFGLQIAAAYTLARKNVDL